MRIVRLALIATALTAVAAGAATNRSDPSFTPGNRPGPFPISQAVCPGTAVTTLPAALAGTTCGDTNSITNYSSAPCLANLNFPYPGEDEVYSFTLVAGNNVGFSMDITGSAGDLALFLVGTTCGNGAACVDTSGDVIGPGNGPEVIDPFSYPAGNYFIYIDSYYAASTPGSCGTYTLNITGSLPVELLEFQVN
jgi:hypothetical protein